MFRVNVLHSSPLCAGRILAHVGTTGADHSFVGAHETPFDTLRHPFASRLRVLRMISFAGRVEVQQEACVSHETTATSWGDYPLSARSTFLSRHLCPLDTLMQGFPLRRSPLRLAGSPGPKETPLRATSKLCLLYIASTNLY